MNDALSALLDTFEHQLLGLTRRQFLIDAFQADLDKVTRGEPFRYRNEVLWRMFLDTRDAHVVSLASWARSVYQPDGLIDRLRAYHAHDLPTKRPPGPLDDDPSWRAGRDREHADALARLFPGMPGAYPGDQQFDQLRDAFVARMKPVVEDASNRVRPFDRDPQVGSVKMLDFGELRDAIRYAEQLMNDLSMVGCQRKDDYRETNNPDAADVVPDLVDAIVLGAREEIERARGELDRIAFYDELRHRHATHTKRPTRFFNDKIFAESDDGSPTQSETRYVGFFPALPLDKNLELGEWVVGTPPAATPWASDRFRELSESLIRSFKKRDFEGGAMLWHRDRGFDGSKPTNEEIGAIRAAVTFAVLDTNDRLRLTEPDHANQAREMATTENADLFIQPITDDNGGITHRRGGLLRGMLVGNMKIGGAPPPLADAVEKIDRPVPVSAFLARAVYDTVRTENRRGRAIATAAEWHRVALSNPEAVTMGQRLIVLKTGFEALFRTSNSRVAARKLRSLFESRTRARKHLDLLPWDGLLWSPREKRYLWRWCWIDGERQIEAFSEIEHWFMALADARNAVIHEGRLTTWTYEAPPERPLSVYAGWLLWVGERVLREAIKAKIGPEVLLCGAIARRAWAEKQFGDQARQLMAAAKARAKARAAAGTEPARPAEAHAPRSLSKILAFLGVPAANLVVVEVLTQLVAGYTHGASARRGRVKMSITESEFLALRAAGAEDKLHRFWYPCP